MFRGGKETQEPTERAPDGQSWYDLSSKIKNTILDYHPKYILIPRVHTDIVLDYHPKCYQYHMSILT